MTSQKPIALLTETAAGRPIVIALIKPRSYQDGKAPHDTTSRAEAATVFCDARGHVRGFATWTCGEEHESHLDSCPRAFHVTTDDGVTRRRFNRSVGRVYTKTEKPPSPTLCPFEIWVVGNKTVHLYCFHHSRTFLAFRPLHTLDLVVRSAVRLRREPAPVLDLQISTRANFEKISHLVAADDAPRGAGAAAGAASASGRPNVVHMSVTARLDKQGRFVCEISAKELGLVRSITVASRAAFEPSPPDSPVAAPAEKPKSKPKAAATGAAAGAGGVQSPVRAAAPAPARESGPSAAIAAALVRLAEASSSAVAAGADAAGQRALKRQRSRGLTDREAAPERAAEPSAAAASASARSRVALAPAVAAPADLSAAALPARVVGPPGAQPAQARVSGRREADPAVSVHALTASSWSQPLSSEQTTAYVPFPVPWPYTMSPAGPVAFTVPMAAMPAGWGAFPAAYFEPQPVMEAVPAQQLQHHHHQQQQQHQQRGSSLQFFYGAMAAEPRQMQAAGRPMWPAGVVRAAGTGQGPGDTYGRGAEAVMRAGYGAGYGASFAQLAAAVQGAHGQYNAGARPGSMPAAQGGLAGFRRPDRGGAGDPGDLSGHAPFAGAGRR